VSSKAGAIAGYWDFVGNHSVNELHARIRELRETIVSELRERKFFFVTRSDLYENANFAFGLEVYERFPDARTDIVEANKALALERSTASVFHSMRIAESGLRHLGRLLKVKLKKNKALEFADWKAILDAVNAKLTQLRNSKRSRKQDRLLGFYGEVETQLRSFKDAWRDRTMHGRTTYDSLQAESVLNHVKEFMQRLASAPSR
jgi:hypothetical protein